MMFGIIIGDMAISTTLSTIGMIPSILFVFVGAAYARKWGNKKTIIDWNYICIGITVATILFFVGLHMFSDTRNISTMFPLMIVFMILQLLTNGAKMCITSGNTAFMADVIDYELDRGASTFPR